MNLPHLVVRYRRWSWGFWAILAVVLLPQARRVGSALEVGARVDGSQSAAVERLLAGPLASAYARFAVLVVRGVPSPTTPAGMTVLGQIVDSLRTAPEVAGTLSYRERADTMFLAPDGTGTFIVVGFAAAGAAPDRLVAPLRMRTEHLAPQLRHAYPEITLEWTGETPLNVDLRKASGDAVGHAERRALPITAVLLLVAFGAIVAALLPVASGALAIAIALGAAALITRIWPLSILLQSVVTMLGLGLGIDYALLMVSRFREAMAEGAPAAAAAESAARHAGHTIILSAASVALGFVMLLTVPLTEMRAIGVGGLLVVLVSALLATTLLPGLLAAVGARIDWGTIRLRRNRTASSDWWRRLGRWVTSHPWTALLSGSVPLLLLATQALHLKTGLPRGEWLPPTMESAHALADLRAMGRGSVIQSVRIVVQFPADSSVRRPAAWSALAGLADSIAADRRVERVRSVVSFMREFGLGQGALAFLPDTLTRGLLSRDGTTALLEVVTKESVDQDGLEAFVREVRARSATVPGMPGTRVMVGGLPAFNTDYHDALAGRFWTVVALVVVATLLALFAGFRSILVPLKAVLLNVMSVAAAFGAVTLVFQDGIGGRVFGVTQPLGTVFSTLPIVVFCIVFGLSMDYEVFLVTRVMECWRAGRSNTESIIEALGTTGHVISSAAAIMLAVFAAFTTGDFLLIKMLGFALAVAVLLDATLVRMLIGPSLLQLAGRWNWWPGDRVSLAPSRNAPEPGG